MSINQVRNSDTNISSILRNNAISSFEQQKKPVEEQEAILQQQEEEQKEFQGEVSTQISKKYSKEIGEIKEFAKNFGEELSDEDITYALRYGRSVLADYSA